MHRESVELFCFHGYKYIYGNKSSDCHALAVRASILDAFNLSGSECSFAADKTSAGINLSSPVAIMSQKLASLRRKVSWAASSLHTFLREVTNRIATLAHLQQHQQGYEQVFVLQPL